MQRISNKLFETYKQMLSESNYKKDTEKVEYIDDKSVEEGNCGSSSAKNRMTKRANKKSKMEECEDIKKTTKVNFVIEDTYEISIPSSITYQDYLDAINTIVDSEDEDVQQEIVSIANEAFENDNIEVIAEAELIKQGIIESSYKATRMGNKEYSPELNMDIDRTKPGVTRVSRRIKSGEGKGTTATERRTMKRIASRNK
jgi:hypothetical protein